MSEFKAKDIIVMNVPEGSFYDYKGLMVVSIAIVGEPKVFVGWHPIFKYGMVAKSVIRHATPEEIKAGYRIDQCQHEWNETTSNGDKYRFFVCKHCDSTRNFEPLEVLEHEENHISPNCKSKDV